MRTSVGAGPHRDAQLLPSVSLLPELSSPGYRPGQRHSWLLPESPSSWSSSRPPSQHTSAPPSRRTTHQHSQPSVTDQLHTKLSFGPQGLHWHGSRQGPPRSATFLLLNSLLCLMQSLLVLSDFLSPSAPGFGNISPLGLLLALRAASQPAVGRPALPSTPSSGPASSLLSSPCPLPSVPASQASLPPAGCLLPLPPPCPGRLPLLRPSPLSPGWGWQMPGHLKNPCLQRFLAGLR